MKFDAATSQSTKNIFDVRNMFPCFLTGAQSGAEKTVNESMHVEPVWNK